MQSLAIRTHLFVFMHSAADEATAVLNKKTSDGGASPLHKSAPMRLPPTTIAEDVITEEGKPNPLHKAWEMMQKDGIAKDDQALAAFMNDIGVDDAESFEYLVKDREHFNQLLELLKPMKSRQLGDCLKPVLNC